jgi:predicted alpha/beta-hydrolase family hydrolase
MKRDVTIDVAGQGTVSGLWLAPEKPRACLVLAHGAGAGMAHVAMAAIAEGLSERGIASLRFQFPYMQRGSKRVDAPKVAHATVRAAVAEAQRRAGKLPLFAGGKSFGGRMTSQTQAETPLAGVRGLVFFGFPLHPAGAPAVERADHLKDIAIPLLFLQGSNDALADVALLRPTVAKLGRRATLKLFDDADHSFHVPKRSGRTNAEVMNEVLDFAAQWMLKADAASE